MSSLGLKGARPSKCAASKYVVKLRPKKHICLPEASAAFLTLVNLQNRPLSMLSMHKIFEACLHGLCHIGSPIIVFRQSCCLAGRSLYVLRTFQFRLVGEGFSEERNEKVCERGGMPRNFEGHL